MTSPRQPIAGRWTRYKLWSIRRLLWRADAVICSLPSPAAPEGEYFDLWGDLGSVHRAVDRAYGGFAMTGKLPPSRDPLWLRLWARWKWRRNWPAKS